MDLGRATLVAVTGLLLLSASPAARGKGGGAKDAPAAKVRTGQTTVEASQFGSCTPRESRSERGCDLTPPPPDDALDAPLELRRGTTVRVSLPFAARRLNANLVVRHAEDSVSAVGLGAEVASESRRRWIFEVPAAAGLDYDRLLLRSTSRRGMSRTYYARVSVVKAE